MSAGGAFAPVRMWMATALNAPKAVIDALERFIADKSVSFREMADLPGHTVIGRDSASAGIPEAVTITGGLEFTGTGSIQRSALTSDVTAPAGSGVTTIAPHAVTNGKFRQSAGLSVVGNATNATADVADIAAASDGQVLRRSGTGIAFGAVNLASANAITGNLPVANLNSGTGASSTTFWRGDGTWAPAGAGTVTSVASADGSITVTNPSTTVDLAVVKAPKWTTARTVAMSGDVVWSVSLDGSANVTAGGTIQAGAVTESKIGLSNVTTNNVSTSAHGFAPILPNDATKYLDGTGAYSVPAGSGVTSPFFPPQGRLTLVTGVPVMISDQTAKGTIYWTPDVGNQAPIWNGSSWTILAAASDVTYALNATPHTSGNLYDLFLYNSSGSLALGTSPAWTNSTTRSNAISMKSGIWTNTSSITLTPTANGATVNISANQATYVGTFYATANGQTGMVFRPAKANGGTNNILGLYNAYNRVSLFSREQDGTGSWTYSTATWRASNASNSNRISWVDGLGQSTAFTDLLTTGNGSTGSAGSWGVSFNTVAQPNIVTQTNFITNLYISQTVRDSLAPTLGFNFAQAMEDALAGTFLMQGSGTPQTFQLSVQIDM